MATWGRTDHHLKIDKRGCGKETHLPANNSLLKRWKGHTDYKMGCRTGTDIEECFVCLCIPLLNCLRTK